MYCTKQLMEFAKKHQLSYNEQFFYNYYNRNDKITAVSLYNKNGCFTITCFEQKQELSYYYSPTFSNDLKYLESKEINVFSYQQQLWKKKMGIWGLFFECNKKVLTTLIEVMEKEIESGNGLFGIALT